MATAIESRQVHSFSHLPKLCQRTTRWRRGSNPQYLGGHSLMASAVARAYTGGLGAEPSAGSRAEGQEGKAPPETEALLIFGV